MQDIRQLALIATLALVPLFVGCGAENHDEPPATTEPPASAETGHSPADTPGSSAIPRTPAPEGARVFFITPADGDTVTNPIAVEFGIEGMAVVKAGDNTPKSGHHHLIIDVGLPDLGLPIPADENHIHFGDGSTATELTLEPGTHSLQLLLGDYLHIPHEPPVVSESINIIVE